jgi:trk system potassium uptake protein TrkH
LFDAICHSFSTISTGGFSTLNDGISGFNSPYVTMIITFFMFAAGINLALLFFIYRREPEKAVENHEFLFYVIITLFFSAVVTIALRLGSAVPREGALINAIFHVISIITTTGFYIDDYSVWGSFLVVIIFILMFAGGMSGSASGGIKMIRLLIVGRTNRKEIKRLLHPSAYLPVHVDKRTVPQNILLNLMIFVTLYLITVCAGALAISLMDYDFITSFSTSASILGNIGPGIGTFGPFSDFAELPVAGKWFLSGLMLLGRLDLLAVMVIFSGPFHKR